MPAPGLQLLPSRHTPPPHPSRQVISKEEFSKIFGPAAMHAVGHVAANISFAAVAISLTHTVKTLEPAFNVVLSKLVLGEGTPVGAVLSLIPIIVSGGRAVTRVSCVCGNKGGGERARGAGAWPQPLRPAGRGRRVAGALWNSTKW